ncbi:hypothetical protein NBRC10512_002510 [Rhodotorula toruloides]|uniref:RHTO0S01e08064g1_1 n=1 Tax=Rhodotorula toruloides TaxID=5286 RepID=A0A061AFB1_RHOTO|nr:RHTO0S01e08064g1_1 [Rhodotorula toruloides]
MDAPDNRTSDDSVRPCTVSWAAQLLQQFQTSPLDPAHLAHPPPRHPFGFSDVAQYAAASPAANYSAGSSANALFPPPIPHFLSHHPSPAYPIFDASGLAVPSSTPTYPFGFSCAPASAYNASVNFAYAASPSQETSLTSYEAPPPTASVHPLPFAPIYPTSTFSATSFSQPSTYAEFPPAPGPLEFAPIPPVYHADSPLVDSSLAGFRFVPPSTSPGYSTQQNSTLQDGLSGRTDSQGAISSFASSQSSAPLFLPASPAPFEPVEPGPRFSQSSLSTVTTAYEPATTATPEDELGKVVANEGSTGRPTRSSRKRAIYIDDESGDVSSEDDAADQADDGGEYRPSRKRSKSSIVSSLHRRQLSISSISSAMSTSTATTSPATSPVRTTSTRQSLHKPLEVIDVKEIGEWTSETVFFAPWRQKEDVRVIDAHGNELPLSPTIGNPSSFTYDPTLKSWRTYRRNFLTLTISLDSPLALDTLRTSHSLSPIKHVEVGLTSATFPKGANAELLQFDGNRKLRDAVTLGRQVLESAAPPPKVDEERPQDDAETSTPTLHRYTSTFRRVQFRHSTANHPSLAANATDKHFLVRCTLYAVHEDETVVELGGWSSAMLIVRGRSPGNFGEDGKGKKKSSKRVPYGADTDTTDDDAPGEVVLDDGGNIVVLGDPHPLPSDEAASTATHGGRKRKSKKKSRST